MQIKKYAACAVLGMMSFFTANAQDIMPEALPTRSTAERIVKEVAPVSASFQSESAQTVESSVSYNASFGENVVQTALQYLGASYRLGTSGPTVFDCSGFTMYVYKHFGIKIPHGANSQYRCGKGTKITKYSDLQVGDIVMLTDYETGKGIGHCGIYLGNDNFIHASTTCYAVEISSFKTIYKGRFYAGLRLI